MGSAHAGPNWAQGPHEALIRRIELTARRLAEEGLIGRYLSAFKGSGLEFVEVRAYAAGDDVRDVDWKVSARTGELFVRRYQEERELSVLLLLDVSSSMSFGSRRVTKRTLAAVITAVLGHVAAASRDRVGLLLSARDLRRFVPAGRGRAHALRLAHEVLTAAPPAGTATDLGPALAFAAGMLRRTTIVFVVSDFMTRRFSEPLAVLARRHDVVPVWLSDPAEHPWPRPAEAAAVGLPPLGLMEILDPETLRPRLIDTSDPGTRELVRRHLERQRHHTRTSFERLGLEPLELSTISDVGATLHEYFRRRARRLGRGG